MHPLDILSESPHLFILQKESNKTNLGGVLFSLYLIVIVIIIVYYIIDYIENDKYIIQSFSHFNIKTKEEQYKINEDALFDPYINFKLNYVFVIDGKERGIDNENFLLYDNKKEKAFSRNSYFNSRISDFDISVVYECKESNCSDYYDLLEKLKKENGEKEMKYNLYFQYDGFTLLHQNADKPILKKENGQENFDELYEINSNRTSNINNQWRNILYTEKRGFIQKDSNDSCGYIENYNTFIYEDLSDLLIVYYSETSDYYDLRTYLVICRITFTNDNMQYTQYFRKKISLLDVAANILSLMANIFTGAKFILRLYSNNFNSFKILEKLLNKNSIQRHKIKENMQMDDLENNKFITIKDDLKEKCIDKSNIQNDINKYDDNKENIDINVEDKFSLDDKRIKKTEIF